jgi:NADPH:quinone reductase-like Zn-dependent oxidoreductase
MKALQFTEYGGPEVLSWGDAPVPHAGPGQIRVAVRAASVNPADWKMLSGAMSGGQPLTGTGYIGYDAAGVVDEVGEGVTGVSAGDEVFGRGQHTQAEYAVLNAWAPKPPSIDWAAAAAAGVAGETRGQVLRSTDHGTFARPGAASSDLGVPRPGRRFLTAIRAAPVHAINRRPPEQPATADSIARDVRGEPVPNHLRAHAPRRMHPAAGGE